MVKGLPVREDRRPSQPYLPPLPRVPHDPSTSSPPLTRVTSTSPPNASPRHSLSSSPAALAKGNSHSQIGDAAQTLLSAANAGGTDEGSSEAVPTAPSKPLVGMTRQLGRARGMKPLQIRSKASPPPPITTIPPQSLSTERAAAASPAVAEVHTDSSVASGYHNRNNQKGEKEDEAEEEEGVKSSASGHPCRPSAATKPSDSYRRALWRPSPCPRTPTLPPCLDTVPAAFRSGAAQFAQAIRRLNRMTAAACSPDDTTALAFLPERPHGGPFALSVPSRPLRQQDEQGVHALSADTPTASSANGVAWDSTRVRKLACVSLLPLIICTDGRTVLLIDRNGTAQHGNYVQAVESYGQPGEEARTASLALWWTLAEVVRGKGRLPLRQARATHRWGPKGKEEGRRAADGNASGAAKPAMASAALSIAPSARAGHWSTLQRVLPSQLSLPYSEGIVLVLTDSEDAFSGSSLHHERQQHMSPEQQEQQRQATSARSPSQDFLQDLRHGYLPALLQAAYPHGGVQLRGCWCDITAQPTAKATSRSGGTPKVERQDGTMPADGVSSPLSSAARYSGGADEDVLTLCVPSPLVQRCDASPAAAGRLKEEEEEEEEESGQGDGGGGSGTRSDAETMRSLFPTSLPPSHSVKDGTHTPAPRVSGDDSAEPTVVLPAAVMAFMLPPTDGHRGSTRESRPGLFGSGGRRCGDGTPLTLSLNAATGGSCTAVQAAVGGTPFPISREGGGVETVIEQKQLKKDAEEERQGRSVGEGATAVAAVVGPSTVADDKKARHVAPPLPLNAAMTFVSPLVRADPATLAALHVTQRPSAAAATALPAGSKSKQEGGEYSPLCASVTVLTPVGRVEFPVPPPPTAAFAPVTVADIKVSLVRSAAGLSMQLRLHEVGLAYAPGSPLLDDGEVMRGAHVVLRLRRCHESNTL